MPEVIRIYYLVFFLSNVVFLYRTFDDKLKFITSLPEPI